MQLRQSTEPGHCGYCGKPGTRFYSFSNTSTPDICLECLRQLVTLVRALVEGK